MKHFKIILVLLAMFFCVGFLAPPALALDRDPNQPRLDRPPSDEDPWGEQNSIGNTGGDLKSIQPDTEQNYIEIFFEFSKIYIKSLFIHKIDNNVKVIHKKTSLYEIRQFANPEESTSATSGR